MRTHVVIDDKLMEKALAITGIRTKKAVIEEALRLLVQMRGQEQVRSLRGQLQWEGDLDLMRQDRFEYGAAHRELSSLNVIREEQAEYNATARDTDSIQTIEPEDASE